METIEERIIRRYNEINQYNDENYVTFVTALYKSDKWLTTYSGYYVIHLFMKRRPHLNEQWQMLIKKEG